VQGQGEGEMVRKLQRAILREWEELPEFMRVPEVRGYWEELDRKRPELVCKRIFDVTVSSILLLFLVVPMAVIAVVIKADSPGPVFYRQERVTAYGRRFRIHKFRTMVADADKKGGMVTVKEDRRVTKAGGVLRKYRLDELPQLLDILAGDMSFVGTRPEVVKYVKMYKREYRATLLLPAGVTSMASIRYKDESRMLDGAGGDEARIDRMYIREILPRKMKWNLESIRRFSLSAELATMARTVLAVFGREHE
jgi:lipopolysaccharide/colanic/teichoic acid biosynthesis glycosyltransferase